MQTNHKSVSRDILPWLMISLGALFYCYEFLLRVAPSTMLDDFMRIYKISAFQVGNIAAFYTYAYTPMQLLVGPMFDKFGLKRLMLVAVFVCLLGSGLLAYERAIWACQIGLFLMGLGSAFAFVGTLKLASLVLHEKYLALVSGLTVTLGMLGAICGQSITANINHHFGFETSWMIFALAGAVLFAIMFITLKEPQNHRINADALNLSSFKSEFKNIVVNKKLFMLGIIGGVMFLPISVFGTLWGIPYMTHVMTISTREASLIVPFVFVGMAIGAPFAGWLDKKYPKSDHLIMAGATAMSVITILLISFPLHTITGNIIELFLLGTACGSQTLVFSLAIKSYNKEMAGTVSSYINFLVMAMGALMQVGIGYILDLVWDGKFLNGVHEYSANNYRIAMIAIPTVLVICTICYARSEKNYHRLSEA
jgi:MFS family permease